MHIPTSLLFQWSPVTKNSSIYRSHQVRCFFDWRQKQRWLPTGCASLKNRVMEIAQNK